jgi:hypothetical protein
LGKFKLRQEELKNNLKEKFKEMRAILKVQEQMADAILKKNLTHIENELKSLKSIDYKMFTDAEKWLKNAKVKLDNFEANNNNNNYIAFDMLANAKTSEAHDFLQDPMEENLLDDEGGHTHRSQDIIAHGEKIAEQLEKIKTANPNVLSN